MSHIVTIGHVLRNKITLGAQLAINRHVSSRDSPQSLEFWEDGRQSVSYTVVTRKRERKAAITPSIAKPSAKLATCRLSRTILPSVSESANLPHPELC